MLFKIGQRCCIFCSLIVSQSGMQCSPLHMKVEMKRNYNISLHFFKKCQGKQHTCILIVR